MQTNMPPDSIRKYFLHSKSTFNSHYTLNLLFLHIQELLLTKFLNALFIQDTASLESSEVEVRSISLIIAKTHFFKWNFIFIPFFFKKPFSQKQSVTF